MSKTAGRRHVLAPGSAESGASNLRNGMPALFSFLAGIMLAPAALSQVYYVPEPINPTSFDECNQMSDQFQAQLHQIMQELNACWKNHSKEEFPQGDVGPCCREYSGTSAVSLGSCWEPFRPCLSVHERWYCTVITEHAAVQRCQDKVSAYQKKQEEDRKRAEEEARQRQQQASSAQGGNSGSDGQNSGGGDKGSDQKSEAEKFRDRVEAYEKETDRLVERTAKKDAQVARLDKKAEKARQEMGREADKVASAQTGLVDRMKEASGALTDAMKGKDSGQLGFVLGDTAEEQTSRVLSALELGVPNRLSIQYKLLKNIFVQEARMVDQLGAEIASFDGRVASAPPADPIRQFAAASFGPRAFLSVLVEYGSDRAGEAVGNAVVSSAPRPMAGRADWFESPAGEVWFLPAEEDDELELHKKLASWAVGGLVSGALQDGAGPLLAPPQTPSGQGVR